MPARLLAFSEWLYASLLRAYPAAFQARFAGEMAQVYRALCRETYRERGMGRVLDLMAVAVWDWGWAVIVQWWAERSKRKVGINDIGPAVRRYGPRLLFAILLGILNWWVWGFILGGRFMGAGLLIFHVAVCWLEISALAWAVRRTSHGGWIAAAVLLLGELVLPTSMMSEDFLVQAPELIRNLASLVVYMIPCAALVVAALLLGLCLKQVGERRALAALAGEAPPAVRKPSGRTIAIHLILSGLLLAVTLDDIYWLIIWDNTTDSLGNLWLQVPILAAIFAGGTLAISLPGRAKLVGLFALVVPVLMFAVSDSAQRVDYQRLTEQRAGQTRQAIEAYFARAGRYPQDLGQLVPWTTLSIPGPVLILGQNWCYDGGSDFYRLGAVTREHWSSPLLSGRVYQSAGVSPALPPICQREIAAMRELQPNNYYADGQ